MNPLAFGLPDTVDIGGVAYPIDTSHRTGIKFEAIVAKPIPDEVKVDAALHLYYGDVPDDASGALAALLWFYRLGQPPDEVGGPRVYDFTVDFGIIDASFRRSYGINLYTAELHWWEFRSLLLGLPDDSAFMKVIGYRTAKTHKMPREQREFYARMKRLYALPGTQERTMTLEEVRRAKFGDVVDTVS